MKKLLWFFVLLPVAFVAVGQFLPREVHVERSIAVNRPVATVFTLLNSYRTFNRWSPWAALDPAAEYVFSGPDSGVGARMEWRGDPALVGSGWQEITASEPDRRIASHLDFGPQGVADSYFEISGDQLGSRVTWGFDTDVTEGQGFVGALMGRWFGLFLDRWVGTDYEKGLRAFKAFAESLPARDFSGADIEILEVAPHPILFVSGSSSRDPAAVAEALATAYGEVMDYVSLNDVEVTGQPMAITREWNDAGYQFEAAIPVAADTLAPEAGPSLGQSPAGKAVRIVHTGSYADTGVSYEQALAWMAAHGLVEGPVSWEHYISDPGEVPEAELVTHIYFLVE